MRTRPETKITRQEVHWVPESRLVPISGKPKRVWTLYHHRDVNVTPTLPIVPKHLDNAFLEDRNHDWTMFLGKLKYFSRVAPHSIWLLVEFES